MKLFNFAKKEPGKEGVLPISAGDEIAPELVKKPITKNEIRRATEILQEYKRGKTDLENRLRAHEEFWKQRQWKSGVGNARISGEDARYKVYSTPWLHTCIETRIADAMDAYPTCKFHPRNEDDEEEAKMLTKIVPVILSRIGYQRTYRRTSRYGLMHGAFLQGVFWDPKANGGLGAIEIKSVDAMNLFWQPGIRDIQDSANVFHTTLMDNDAIERMYPQAKNHFGKNSTLIGKYLYDEHIDTKDKSVVIDWYYKKNEGGTTVLHFCKYVNDVVLYSSENDGLTEGYYHHGQFPFEMNPLYEVEGSPFGYGLIDTCESTQLQIDLLNKAICDNATEGSRPRYLYSAANTINPEELNDPTVRLVRVEGKVDEEHLRQIETSELPGIYVSYLNNLVEQLKFCTANQDVNNGAAPSGVTSYSALSALQETSGKKPRETNRTFYDSFKRVIYFVIELIRQFYVTPQQFRIDGADGKREYITYTNAGLQPQDQMTEGVVTGKRKPQFDIEVTCEKADPYKKLSHNEFILQLYNLGAFNPKNVDQALALIDHLDFDDKEKIVETIKRNKTLTEWLVQFQQIALSLAQQTDPALADQLAQIISQTDQGITGSIGTNVDPAAIVGEKEHPYGKQSREQARASTQVS